MSQCIKCGGPTRVLDTRSYRKLSLTGGIYVRSRIVRDTYAMVLRRIPPHKIQQLRGKMPGYRLMNAIIFRERACTDTDSCGHRFGSTEIPNELMRIIRNPNVSWPGIPAASV